MKKSIKIIIKIWIILFNIIFFFTNIYLYLSKIIIYELFLAIIFFQILFVSISLALYLFVYKKLQNLAKELNFRYLKGSFPHPKFEGYYKNNWFQLHYVSRDYGSNWGQPRIYIKLQYKEPKKFDDLELKKYNNYYYKEHKIVEINHIIRDYKNYLLLKREWPTFQKTKIQDLMNFLIELSNKTEIKEKRKKFSIDNKKKKVIKKKKS